MMRLGRSGKMSIQQKHYVVVVIIIAVLWLLSSYAATALECFSEGGEIAFGLTVDCSIDFSDQ
ncbi:MAG: hypothetical protein ABJF50_10460 [Paracoccaceae bacterium]